VAQALVSGSLQVAEGGFQSTLLADLASGNSTGSYPFLVFASYETTNDYALVVSNSIHSWSDLAGQPIATSGPGSSSNLFCNQLLLEHGLSGNQINCAPIGGGGSRIRALLAGKVVGDIAEPFAVVSAVATGNFHIIATIPQQFPDLIFSVLYTSRAYANAHPDVIVKITESILLADRWAQNQTAWLAKEQAAFPDTDAKVAATSWKIWLAMNLWDPHGGLSNSKIQYSENYLVKVGAVSSYLDPKYWVDLSYQTQALQNIGAWNGPPGGYPNPNIPTLNVTIPGFSGAPPNFNMGVSPGTTATFAQSLMFAYSGQLRRPF
jgi:ABC-type nitrate/sulfonate/bicarbonate transport system substrate-binding protein